MTQDGEPPPLARGRRQAARPYGARPRTTPLARGRRHCRRRHPGHRGTTPAGAGPTAQRATAAGNRANHPRWRGADRWPTWSGWTPREPPPLARGRQMTAFTKIATLRTTPAGAGPTRRRRRRGRGTRNHPRWRGADAAEVEPGDSLGEPPPLARGRPRPEGAQARRPRTTPAGAGPTVARCGWRGAAGNHPRWRGADGAGVGRGGLRREPPPLARGRPVRPLRHPRAGRTTPAGAGPTPGATHWVWQCMNHPRWRGADERRLATAANTKEPPPLARGRRHDRSQHGHPRRTTPAGAGPTGGTSPSPGPGTNHPRWRGADYRTRWPSSLCSEPPPLARGRLVGRPSWRNVRRTTPAGAGPTLADLGLYSRSMPFSFSWRLA